MNIKYHIVIVSNKNISKTKMDKTFSDLHKLKLRNIEVYVLTSGIHPNFYKENQLHKLIINYDDFDRLINNLNIDRN